MNFSQQLSGIVGTVWIYFSGKGSPLFLDLNVTKARRAETKRCFASHLKVRISHYCLLKLHWQKCFLSEACACQPPLTKNLRTNCRTPTNGNLSTKVTFLADSPYIDFGQERIKGTLYPLLLWFKPLYEVHLTITATFVCPQGGRCGVAVRLYFDLGQMCSQQSGKWSLWEKRQLADHIKAVFKRKRPFVRLTRE